MAFQDPVKQEEFNLNWEHTKTQSTTLSEGFFAMREWQAKAFDRLKNVPFMILNAPMGSGKSWLMCLLSAYKMKEDPSLRCIIAVPQTIIAPGFIEAKLQMPNGEKLHWTARHNLCDEESNTKTVSYAIKWLERPCDSFSDRILVCTHATLVAVYKKLKTQARLNLLQDLLLWIDEAHHIKNTAIEGFDGSPNSNSIGELVAYLLNQANHPIQLGLTTASFFRGDRHSLLTNEMEAKFERHNLAYDEYLKSMKYLKTFTFDFLLCGHDYTRAIEILINTRKGKDIIYVPHPKSRHSTGDKYKEVKNIITKYQEAHSGEIVDLDNGLTVLRGENTNFKILDLVDEDRRSEKKTYLNSPDIKHNPDALDVIISLGMFKEGANWIWANRSIIAGARSSLVDIIQMIGRLFRDAKDKEHVEVIQLLPFSLDQEDNEVFRDNLNNYLKAIYASLMLEDILNPIKIKLPLEKNETHDKSDNAIKKQEISLTELIPDETTQLLLKEEITKQLLNITVTNKEVGNNIPVLWDEYQKILPETLNKHGINEHIEEIGKLIWAGFARNSLKQQGISVENIDFNILQNIHPLEGLLRYTSGASGPTTFQQLRDAIDASRPPLTKQQIIEWIKQYYNEHDDYPLKESGVITHAKAEFVGETWLKVNSALRGGNRGLPGGSTLARLLEEEFSVKNKMNLPPFSKELITGWIELYHAKYGKYPTTESGLIEFATGEFVGETWAKVDRALLRGYRGLPGESSLASILENNFSKKPVNRLQYTKELIITWIKLYHAKYGTYPTRSSGLIEFATEEFEGETWSKVNSALSRGNRGLPTGLTLAKFLENEFGVRHPENVEPLNRGQIVGWIKQYFDKHNDYPNKDSGIVEFAPIEFDNVTWQKIDTALSRGTRALQGGSSLPKLLEEEFCRKNRMDLPNYTKSQIIDWIRQYHEKHGKYPTRSSGLIEYATGEFVGETWAKVDRALVQGGRGLEGKSSLTKLLQEEFNKRNRKNLPKLTKYQIVYWIELYYAKHKKYPNSKSGPIEFAKDETWGRIQTALLEGLRGLPKGSSLPKLLEEIFGVKNHMNLPKYTKELIYEWVELYFTKYNEYPTSKSGPIEFATEEFKGETWAKVQDALLSGNRGLVKGSSLAKLVKEICERRTVNLH